VAAPAAAPASADLSEVKHTGEVAAESLAEVALMQAKRHAREAKQSAALARFAYEKLAKSRETAAEAAGQAVLEDVIIDARKDAGEAVKIRAGWEDEARAHAAQKAVAAAAVYKKAKLRDLQVAEAWEHQATLLLKTSRQYEEYASRQEMKEKKIKAALKKLTEKEEKEEKEIPALVQEATRWTGFAPAPAFAAWQGVAQAPVAAVAPPPASAGGALTIGEVSPPMAQAPVAAVAPSPTSAEMASKELQPVPKVADAMHATHATAAASAVDAKDAAAAKDAKDVKVVPLASSPAAAPTASAVEKTEEKAKEKSEETAKKESKKETEEKTKSEETAKKESKKETEEKTKSEETAKKESKKESEGKEKSEETAKKESKKESEGKEKSEETAKKESKKDTEEGVKAKTTKPVAPPAPAPSVATAIFGGEPLTSPKDEKARLLQDLQTVQAQVDAGLELAHKYELQAFAARKEAQGIRANASWYDGAEEAAAAHTLYAELPKGVIPPPLPALP